MVTPAQKFRLFEIASSIQTYHRQIQRLQDELLGLLGSEDFPAELLKDEIDQFVHSGCRRDVPMVDSFLRRIEPAAENSSCDSGREDIPPPKAAS
jgi:hypothetical protein